MNTRSKIAVVALAGLVAGVLLLSSLIEKRTPSTDARSTVSVASTKVKSEAASSLSAHARMTTGTSKAELSPSDWTIKFRASKDYLSFVKEALPAAEAGDARANWYIGEVLSACALVMKTYHGVADPDAQLNQELASMPNAPQWTRDLLEQKTRRCLGLANDDPLAALPQRNGGYRSAYWQQQALDLGDPLAQVRAASDAIAKVLVTPRMSAAEKSDQLKSADTQLRAAVESGDPDALYYAGTLMSDGRYFDDPLNGIALALASCDLGRDCSAANPENSFANCKVSGACPANADYAYFLQQSLGADKYAQVYARAQQIEQAARSGDWNTVSSSLKLGADGGGTPAASEPASS